MRVRFAKMQGAGNDFVVIDATARPFSLSGAQLRRLADRRYGVGADQVLVVEPGAEAGIDFRYRIFNADGAEVEQCGNGARCFARYVFERGLTDRRRIRVRTMSGVIEPAVGEDGEVTVDMGAPVFDEARVPFDANGLDAQTVGAARRWSVPLPLPPSKERQSTSVDVIVVSMGNPHAVLRVDDAGAAAVDVAGPAIERHSRFPRRTNVGFLQVVSPVEVRLRVWERGVGETLACGTGACAAVAAGVRAGWLEPGATIVLHAPGGRLRLLWNGGDADPVWMTGPAEHVFDGEIEL